MTALNDIPIADISSMSLWMTWALFAYVIVILPLVGNKKAETVMVKTVLCLVALPISAVICWLFEFFDASITYLLFAYAAGGFFLAWRTWRRLRAKTKSKSTENTIYTIAFLIYLIALLYLTVLCRLDEHFLYLHITVNEVMDDLLTDGINMPHFLQNIALFVPLGACIALLHSEDISMKHFILGALTSTLIEGTQMIFQLGDCDLMDIVANTFGTFIGIAFIKLWEWVRINE